MFLSQLLSLWWSLGLTLRLRRWGGMGCWRQLAAASRAPSTPSATSTCEQPCAFASVYVRAVLLHLNPENLKTWMFHGRFEDRNVSMGIFAMHAGAALPLHDHPGMHVMSR